MFAWWGRAVVRWRWGVIAGGILLALIGAVWGTGVFGVMVDDGFEDPGSETTRAAAAIAADIGAGQPDLMVIYSSPDKAVDDPAFRDAVTSAVGEIRKLAIVDQAVTYYDTASPAFVSTD